MKVAICQMNPIIGNIYYNKDKILAGYRRGVEAGADLVVFPELALLGYPPLDLVEKAGFRQVATAAAKEIAAQTGATGLLFGCITEDHDNVGTNLFNSALLCYDGAIQFTQHKTLIPNYDVFDEMRYFEPASDVQVHAFRGELLGISICEDIWNDKDYWKQRLYPNDPVEKLLAKGATLLLNISASPYSYGKREERREMLSVLTRKDKRRLIYCCCAGAQTELIFDGASMCFNEEGELQMLGATYAEDFLLYDTEADYHPLENVEQPFAEEVHDALVFGIKEYCSKLGFTDVLLGLSGGVDSALVAYLAARALGSDHVHCVMMPSRYSSEGSISDSELLAANLGIKTNILSIEPVFEACLQQLTPLFAGKEPGLAEENLQARVRGTYLMALANKFGYLLLTTGNKSEMATGYCTLYGDMNGGLAVIADVYKTDVYRLCRYINRSGEIIPKAIIEKAPSAELRFNQTDQDSLPPYDVLDAILRMYLEQNKEYYEINDAVQNPEFVKRVLRLVDSNEFKRKQAAPALRVSYKAFGYGRRFPIVQGWRK